MSQVIEKESTSLAKVFWKTDGKRVLVVEFSSGAIEYVDPSLFSQSVRVDNEEYGLATRVQRLGALSASEFPTKQARVEEYQRRLRERKAHLYSGAAEWDIPRKAAGPKVTQADVIEALGRAYPTAPSALLFERKLRELADDNAGTIAYWLSTKQVAAAWADIQAERRKGTVGAFVDADDDVARLLAATFDEKPPF